MIGVALAALPQRLLAEVVGVVIEVALVAAVAYHYTAKHYEAVIDRDHAAQAAAVASYAASSAAETARRLGAQQEIVHDAQIQVQRAAADAAAAGRARDSLRLQLDSYVRSARGTGNPAAAGGGATAGDPIGVLADVLSRADERAGLLAAAADASRAAGNACVRAYDALTGSPAPQRPEIDLSAAGADRPPP